MEFSRNNPTYSAKSMTVNKSSGASFDGLFPILCLAAILWIAHEYFEAKKDEEPKLLPYSEIDEG